MSALAGTLMLTGCGGDIALSIARFVREDGLAARIVGADVREDHPGFAFYDEVLRLPRADAPGYIKAFDAATADAEIVVPMSEAELARLLAEGRIGAAGARLLTANACAIATGLDKIETFRLLDAAGIGVPRTGIVGETRPTSFPCIVKLRSGQGSKGLALVEAGDFDRVAETRAGDIWQEYLPDGDQEFTCGLFRLPETGTRSILLRRRLAGGLTGSATVVEDTGIAAMLERVAEAVDLEGAINVQLRIDRSATRIFEINPRFSSTVGFRHRMGFHDFLWSLEHATGRRVSGYEPVAAGTGIYRVGSEIIRPAPGNAR